MTVAYTASGESFLADKPRVWAANVSRSTGFDFAPDGNRLAVIMPASSREVPEQEHTVVFIQNFLDELRRRARVGQ